MNSMHDTPQMPSIIYLRRYKKNKTTSTKHVTEEIKTLGQAESIENNHLKIQVIQIER